MILCLSMHYHITVRRKCDVFQKWFRQSLTSMWPVVWHSPVVSIVLQSGSWIWGQATCSSKQVSLSCLMFPMMCDWPILKEKWIYRKSVNSWCSPSRQMLLNQLYFTVVYFNIETKLNQRQVPVELGQSPPGKVPTSKSYIWNHHGSLPDMSVFVAKVHSIWYRRD